MSGTKTGGDKTKTTIKEKYGEDYYAKIGAIGGKKGTTGGFYGNREFARAMGVKGGTISRRGPKKNYQTLVDAVAIDETAPPVKQGLVARFRKWL